jgi:general stress protein 26
METDKNLSFLNSKMEELGHALFYNFSTAVLKFPVSVIQMAKMDEVGNIWFTVKKPAQSIENFDKDFPAQLHFYKKGMSFHIKVHGKAVIVDDPEELNNLQEDVKMKIARGNVLIKIKILKAEYFDNDETQRAGVLTNIRNFMNKWLFREEPGYHPYFIGSAESAF